MTATKEPKPPEPLNHDPVGTARLTKPAHLEHDGARGSDGIVRPRLFSEASAMPCAEVTESVESESDLRLRYRTWSVQVQGSRSYRFSMPVPAGWVWVPPSGPDVLGVFVPPEVVGPQITVRMEHVRWEVDVLAWLMRRCQTRGLAVTMVRSQNDAEALRFELGGTRDVDGAMWRISAALHMGRLLIVEVLAPLTLWEPMHETFRPCRQKYEILPPPQWATIEPHRTFRTEQVQFSVPSSWIAKEHTVTRGHERYLISANPCKGLLRIDTGNSMVPLHLRQSRILQHFEDLGWSVVGRLATLPSGIRTFCSTSEGRISVRGEAYRLRVAHRRLGTTFIDYTTLIPMAEELAEDAMRTARAAEVAIESTVLHATTDGETAVVRRTKGEGER